MAVMRRMRRRKVLDEGEGYAWICCRAIVAVEAPLVMTGKTRTAWTTAAPEIPEVMMMMLVWGAARARARTSAGVAADAEVVAVAVGVAASDTRSRSLAPSWYWPAAAERTVARAVASAFAGHAPWISAVASFLRLYQ